MTEREDHWLDAVAAILRADTADLRALARLAGEDPRTLYIGTVMDGADLRGQDLRGMTFTHLDRDKVRRDAGTRLDPPDGDDPANEAQPVLILVRSAPLLRAFQASARRKLPGAVIYGPDQEDAFRHDSRDFPGPKFAILDEGLTERGAATPYEPLHAFQQPTVTLALISDGPFLRLRSRIAETDVRAAPVIFVLYAAADGARLATAKVRVVDNTLAFIAANWSAMLGIADEFPRTALISTKATAPGRFADAWRGLLGRLHHADLLDLGGVHLTASPQLSLSGEQAALADAMFLHLRPLQVRASPDMRPNLDAAVLIDLNGHGTVEPALQHGRSYSRYISSIGRLLYARRWDVSRGRDGYRVSTPTSTFQVEFPEPHPPRLEPRSSTLAPLAAVDLAGVRKLIVSEAATPDRIVDSLLHDQTLWVNARDLGAFEAQNPMIWWLFAHQLRRIARAEAAARTRYIALLALAMLEPSGKQPDAEGLLAERLADPEFLHHNTLHCSAFEFRRDHAFVRVQAKPTTPNRRRLPALNFGLLFFQDSAEVIDIRYELAASGDR